jgi:hypothetical protein
VERRYHGLRATLGKLFTTPGCCALCISPLPRLPCSGASRPIGCRTRETLQKPSRARHRSVHCVEPRLRSIREEEEKQRNRRKRGSDHRTLASYLFVADGKLLRAADVCTAWASQSKGYARSSPQDAFSVPTLMPSHTTKLPFPRTSWTART